MKIFVAGATGSIGRRTILRLIWAGHRVTGLAHWVLVPAYLFIQALRGE